MKNVVIKRLFHRDQKCFGFLYDFDTAINQEVKKIPLVKFSVTNKCWYVPDQPDTLTSIVDVLRNKVWVDYPLLKSNRPAKPLAMLELPTVIPETQETE